MSAIIQLENLGYIFSLEGDRIRYIHQGNSPDPAIVGPLLAELKQHKSEALHFLQERHTNVTDNLPAEPPRKLTESELSLRLSQLRNEFGTPAPGDRWVEPIITAGFATMPLDGWQGGVVLYRNDNRPVTFYSIEEMHAATIDNRGLNNERNNNKTPPG